MTPEELTKLSELELRLTQLNDIFYRQHFIDKDVFSNPVYFRGSLIGLPKVSDTPTNTNAENGSMVYDTTNSQICTFNAGVWTCGSLGGVAGSDTQVQFNDGGSMAGDPNFTWDKITFTLQLGQEGTGGIIKAPDTTSHHGTNLLLEAGSATTLNFDGGIAELLGGNGFGGGKGGEGHLAGGDGGVNGDGGNVSLQGGNKGAGGTYNGDIYASGLLGTTANSGFFRIPTCAGAPTGTPQSINNTVPMVYDTTNNKFYIYNSGWKSVTLS